MSAFCQARSRPFVPPLRALLLAAGAFLCALFAGAQTPAEPPAQVPSDTLSNAPDSMSAVQAPLRAFPLPDILDAEQPGAMPAPMDAGMREAVLARPGPSAYDARALSFEATLPPVSFGARDAGLVRARLSDGASREFSAAWATSRKGTLWGGFTDWRHRFDGRSHFGLDIGFARADRAADPRSAVRLQGELRDSDRDSTIFISPPFSSETRRFRLGARWQRALSFGDSRGGLEARARVDGSEYRNRSAGFRALDVSFSPNTPPYDLRLLPAPHPGVLEAGSRPEIAADAGVVHRFDSIGGQTLARLRGHAGWSVPRGQARMFVGLAGGREGGRGVIGPWLAWRSRAFVRGLVLAFEVAPSIRYADEWWGADEPLGDPGLLGPSPLLPLPHREEPLVPRLPAQRAWPRLAGQAHWEMERGWARASLELARVRGPFHWMVDGAPGSAVVATASGETRTLARFAIEGQRSLGAGFFTRLDYRWQSDEERGTAQRLLVVPRHLLRAALGWRAGPWQAAIDFERRAGAYASSSGARLPAYSALGARAGRDFGAHSFALVAENLLAQDLEWWPGERIRHRWFGLEWTLRMASVP